MALTQVTGPYPIFTDLDGSPLDDGYLYIGAINEDPETNPIQVFWDSDLTIPATQPIRTNSGYAWRNGTPALLYTAGEFSITIRNKRQEFVLYSPVGYGFDPAAVSASVVKNDFIGDGVEVDFTLSSAPSTILATNVFINGVYQEKDSYSLFGNVITFLIAPPISSSIEVMTNETGVINSGNATAISYTASFPGAVQQTVQTKLEQYVSVKDFGAVGDGVTDDTVALQAALDWLAGGPRRTLNWDIQTTLISSALSLPDASEWTLNFDQVSRITQDTDNTPIFLMEPSASRYGFELTGAPVWFQWANNQTGADTKSIGVAFKPTTALPDGVYGWEMHTLYNENGYDLIALHPDSVTAGTVCTFWGFQIDKLYHQTHAVGRVFALNSGGGGGSPGSIINAIYIKATNVAASNAMFVKGHAGLRINVIEVNAAFKRALYFESCISPSIGVLRFEIATLTSGEDLMSVAGSTTVMTIDNLEFQAIDTSASAGAAYGIVAFGGAQINVVGGLTVRDCVASNAGRFYVFRPQTDGSNYGRIILPPAASIQKSDNYVQLHTYTEATYVTSSAGIPVGPFFKASVAAVSAFTPMVAFWDGTNNFFDITCPADGYITSVQVALSAAVSAGSIRFYVYKNGSGIAGYLATVSSGTTGSAFAPLAWAPQSINANHKVVRGDLLRVVVEPLTATGGGDATATLFISQLAD